MGVNTGIKEITVNVNNQHSDPDLSQITCRRTPTRRSSHARRVRR